MKVVLPIFALVVITCAAYTCVGRLVPQLEQPPPASAGASASPEDLANAGREIFTGSCAQCHGQPGAGGTERAPDLDGIAARAPGRAEERTKETGTPYTADDYLGESLKDPGAYLVKREAGDPYGNIMSFKLRPVQTLAVLAYLQTLGGSATVTAESEVWKKWGQPIETEEEGEGGGGGPAKPIPQGPPEEIVKKYACAGCHDFEGDQIPSGGGPALSKVGARLSPGDILTQIIMPDSAIAEAPPGVTFPKGLMRSTLEGNGFYTEVGQEDLQKLVLWLSEKKGQ